MVIKIKSNEHNIFIPLPSMILLSNFTAKIIAKKINSTPGQMKLMFKSVRKSRRALKKISASLLYLKSGDGEEVIIKL